MKLNGKIALVTGAGGGIGEGIARRLAEEGAVVVCADIDGDAAQRVAGQCGNGAWGTRVDVSEVAQCESVMESVTARHGQLDVLVNNAGVNRDAMLHKMTDEQWHRVIEVDLSGVFYLTRSAARVMRVAGQGRIVNISSASWLGNIGQSNYAAAKAGVVGLSKTAARELARFQVTVNVICPGFIDTDMTRAMPEQIRDQVVSRIPLGRAGQPADVAAVVAFLASDDAAYLTGMIIDVDGGLVL